MNNLDRYLSLLIVAAGIFSFVCTFKGWDWYMDHPKTRFMTKILGRTGARVFYMILGACFAVFGLLMFFMGHSFLSPENALLYP